MLIKRTIRPVVALILASLVLSTAGFAQERKHDVSIACGFLSIDQIADMVTDVLTIVITLGTFSKDEVKYSAVPFLTYHFSSNSRFGFGFAAGGYNSRGNLRVGETTVGDFRERNYVGAVELDYHWVMKEAFQLYSGAGFGVRFRRGTYVAGDETDKSIKLLPTFHLNAIGMRFGGKVGVFAELGVGYKGLLSAGINAQF